MAGTDLSEKVAHFPAEPGVYLMKGEKDRIIYVGKAINLKSRVRQYLNEQDSRYQVKFLMTRVVDIDYLVCANEKEALLLENSLIKKHKPRYNIFLKDDKSYVSLKLTVAHPYPALSVTRKIRKDGSLYFGPYTSADRCRETVEFVYRHFRLRTCSDHEITNRSRPCLEYQIGRCTAPCVDKVTQVEYAEQVKRVRLLLEGKNEDLMKQIQFRMEAAAQREAFEEAARWRDLLKGILSMHEKQRVVKHGGAHQDLVCLHREGEAGVVAVFHVRGGDLVDSHYHVVKSVEDDEEVLEHFISQYYLGNVFVPDEILVNVESDRVAALVEILSDRKGSRVQVLTPQRGDKKDLLELALRNAREYFGRLVKKEQDIVQVLGHLREILNLPHVPSRIECFDISNTQGTDSTASSVCFIDGLPCKEEYRHYKMKDLGGPDDYAMMREVLERRLSHLPHPDLLVLDGGRGQLSVGVSVLKELNITDVPIISIAKGQGQGARAKGLWTGKKEEEIYLPGRKNPVILRRGSQELFLIQRLRDEAHRFAVKYHRLLRDQKRIS